MVMVIFCVTAIAAYLMGSFPTGYLVARARGVDIRRIGSGNIGATNVVRVLGKKAGVAVLVCDAGKGFLACQFIGSLVQRWLGYPPALSSAPLMEWTRITAGVFAILGHNYTCWLKFRGGKGVATSAGVMTALVPFATAVVVVVWIAVFVLTRYVSLASVVAAFCLPFASWAARYLPKNSGFHDDSLSLTMVSAAIGALAVYKHRSNIRRLLDGTENRFGGRRKPSEPAS